MKKIRKNQNGFGAIELLLLLIFIAIITFIGVYVADAHKSNPTNSNSSSKQSTTNSSNKTAAAAGQRATTIANALLEAGKQGNDGLVSYVDSHVSDGEFTSTFKAAVDKRTALPNGGGSPVACTNGIFPDSFALGNTTISGDTAINSPMLISGGSDVTNQYDQIPQITLTYLNNSWSVVNYTCINNPNAAGNSGSTAGFQ